MAGAALEFAGAVYSHFVSILTGSGLALVLWVANYLMRWNLPRWVYVVIISGSLVFASFQAWQDEHAKLQSALADLRDRDATIKSLQIATRSDPRRAEYRRRLIGIHQQSLRAIRDAEDNWRVQITTLTTEQGRHPAGDPNQKRWQEEIERIRRERYGVVFDSVYQNALQLFDDMKADPLVDITLARKLLDATRVRIDRPQPHPRPEEVRAFADEIRALAEKLR